MLRMLATDDDTPAMRAPKRMASVNVLAEACVDTADSVASVASSTS